MYLIQLPGFGLLTTMKILAATSDIKRFETAKQWVGYAELGAGVHASGETHRTGRITKTCPERSRRSGRREMRWALVEAAWAAVEGFRTGRNAMSGWRGGRTPTKP